MKKEITSAFNKMNVHSNKESISWQGDELGTFGIAGHGKEALGIISVKEGGVIDAKIYLTNYSEKYFLNKLRKVLIAHDIHDFEISFENKWPESGDIVNTQYDQNHALREGERVTLNADTKFYSYDNMQVSCNGFVLGNDFEAEFIEYFQDVCKGSSFGTDTYTKFLLL